MNIEIERKFLVKLEGIDFRDYAQEKYRITQGYLSTNPQRIVRVRVMGDLGFITVKGPAASGGMSRFEWEMDICHKEAKQLIRLCEGIIDKTRYLIPNGDTMLEVDQFWGENEGLFLAEIELDDEDQLFDKPDWLGDEVTEDPRYYNSELVKNPYSQWKDKPY